jgi:hypothetical protein
MENKTPEFPSLVAEGKFITPTALTPQRKPGQDTIPADNLSKYYAGRMDILRFVAICSIVWGHSLCSWADKTKYQEDYRILTLVANQLGRLGTINFFLISGYFLSKKISGFSIVDYLKYRLPTIILPWLIFLIVLAAIQVLDVYSFHQILTGNTLQILKYTLQLLNGYIFHAAYWYIPVSILSALVLILCKKYINKTGFGFILLGFTLFYSINLYYNWVSALHTKAFLGYVFFLWLGVQLYQHKEKFEPILNKIQWKVLIPLFLLAFTVACFEAEILSKEHSKDSFSSIRITNLIVCLLFFLAVLKSNRLTVLKHLNPRQNVFGIYLVHCIVIVKAMPLANTFIWQHNLISNLPVLFLTQIAFFLIIMSVTFVMVWAIHSSPISFILGRSKSRLAKQQNP